MAEKDIGGISWVVDADTSPAINSTRQLDAQVDKVGRSLTTLDTKVSKTSKAVNANMGSLGRTAGQAGIQIQQLIGQIQGGQSAMLALSQQGADLGFVLGVPLLGAVVGIGASIAGMLLPNLMDTKTALEKVDEVTQNVTAALTLSADGVADYGDHLKILKQISTELLDIRLRNLKAIQAEAVALSAQGIEETIDQYRGLNFEMDLFGKRTEKGARAFIDLSTTAKRFASLPTEDNMQAYVDALWEFQDAGGDATKAGRELIANSASLIQKWHQGKLTIDELTKSIVNNDRVTTDWGKRRTDEARKAARAVVEANRAAIDADLNGFREMERLRKEHEEKKAKGEKFAVSVVGRGLSDADKLAMENERLKELYDQGLIDKALFNDAMDQLDKERAANQRNILMSSLGAFEGTFGGIADILRNSVGEQSAAFQAMFILAKGFAIAQASLNLTKAISDAMAWGGLTPMEKFASAAAVGAAATSLVGQIAGASYSGREHGGPMLANVPYEVGEKNKPELLMIPGNNGKMFSNSEVKSMMGGGGGVTLNQQIVTPPGYTARTTGDGVNQKQVVEIVKAEMSNSNSGSRRALTSGTNVQNTIKGGR